MGKEVCVHVPPFPTGTEGRNLRCVPTQGCNRPREAHFPLPPHPTPPTPRSEHRRLLGGAHVLGWRAGPGRALGSKPCRATHRRPRGPGRHAPSTPWKARTRSCRPWTPCCPRMQRTYPPCRCWTSALRRAPSRLWRSFHRGGTSRRALVRVPAHPALRTTPTRPRPMGRPSSPASPSGCASSGLARRRRTT